MYKYYLCESRSVNLAKYTPLLQKTYAHYILHIVGNGNRRKHILIEIEDIKGKKNNLPFSPVFSVYPSVIKNNIGKFWSEKENQINT